MLRSSIWLGLSILYGTILAEHAVPHDGKHHYISRMTDYTPRTRRFDISFLDEIRRNFCRSFCTSADTVPYIMNLICAAKCPELYLPHRTTTSTPASTAVPPIISGITTSTTSTTTSTTTSQSGQGMSSTPSRGQGTMATTSTTSTTPTSITSITTMPTTTTLPP